MFFISNCLDKIISNSLIEIVLLSKAILFSFDIKITISGASALALVLDIGGVTSNKSFIESVPESIKNIRSKNTIFIKGTKLGNLLFLIGL
jgi:hypothetical protein